MIKNIFKMSLHFNGVRTELLESILIASRLPQYFDNPMIWFQQAEAISRKPDITHAETKFMHTTDNQ